MPRQVSGNEQIRKLGQTGSSDNPSYFVTLPIELVRQLGWREGQRLVVRMMQGQPRLVIEDWNEG